MGKKNVFLGFSALKCGSYFGFIFPVTSHSFVFAEKISYDIPQQFGETHLKLRNPEGIRPFLKAS